MKNIIDLKKRFIDELCTFELAKKASVAGMTCANTFLSYDERGELGDGAWLEDVTGAKMYPAINFPFAVIMLEDTDLELRKINFYEYNENYFFKYKSEMYQSANIVDALIMAWLKHKTS